MGEAQQVHLQLMRMIRDLKRQDDPQPWAEGWQAASSQPSPPPVQSSGASSSIPVKAAPAPRAQQTLSSSMGSAPRNAPFPSQVGADPWAKAKQGAVTPQDPAGESKKGKQHRETSNFPLFECSDTRTSKEECHVECALREESSRRSCVTTCNHVAQMSKRV